VIIVFVDECFVDLRPHQLNSVCSVLVMALTVCMANGTLNDNRKIFLVNTSALFNLSVPISLLIIKGKEVLDTTVIGVASVSPQCMNK